MQRYGQQASQSRRLSPNAYPADSIGDNFRCIHCTTLGNTDKGRPTIGNNVSLGANVTIIGPVHVGNNVTVAAGAGVVKDVPDNCMVAGVPAKIIKQYD